MGRFWIGPVRLVRPQQTRVYGIVHRRSSMLELFLCMGVCVDKVYGGARRLYLMTKDTEEWAICRMGMEGHTGERNALDFEQETW